MSARSDEAKPHGVKIAGFRRNGLNQLYVERRDEAHVIDGRETYWSVSQDYVLYFSTSIDAWCITASSRFHKVKAGNWVAIAHGPRGKDILDVDRPRGWREWQATDWVPLDVAGVQDVGRVRPQV
jgi:hypothetical protein